ncbi:hypothetical protein Tco_0528109 [Tanacetum coccineum]
MSSMGELTFFLGLQVKQKEDGIFISQDKYVGEILKKFGFSSIRIASTPIETNKALTKDEDGKDVDVHLYRSMIGTLMYLTSSRADIKFSVCACSIFQVQPKVSHMFVVNRIFRYLKGQPKLALGILRTIFFYWKAFSQSVILLVPACKGISTSGASIADLKCVYQHNMVAYLEKSDENEEFHRIMDFLSTCSINYALTAVVISESSVRSDLLLNDEDGIACLTNAEIFENLALMGYEQLFTKLTFQKEHQTEPHQTRTPPKVSQEPQIEAHIKQVLPSPTIYQRKHKKTQKPRQALQEDTELPQTSMPITIVADEAVYEERDDRVVWAATTATSLEAVAVLRAKTPLGGGGAQAQTRSEGAPIQPNEPPLLEGHTSGSEESRMEHTIELTVHVPLTPYDSPLLGVLDLEKDKDAQAIEILNLKRRVKKLERKRKSSISHPKRMMYRQIKSFDDDLDGEDTSKQGRKSDKSDKIEPIFKDGDFDDLDAEIEDVKDETVYAATTGVNIAGEGVSTAEPRTPPTTTTIFVDEDVTMTMAQTLIKMKEEKAKEKGVAIKEGVLVEQEPEKPEKVKRRDQGLAQIDADAELAQRLHEEEMAKLDIAQKERQRQEEATSPALTEMFNEVQASINVDALFAAKLQQ